MSSCSTTTPRSSRAASLRWYARALRRGRRRSVRRCWRPIIPAPSGRRGAASPGAPRWSSASVERAGPPFDAVREVEWVPGCAMLLAREALETIGPLDERFFAYHEDVDWCASARSAGFRVLFVPDARVTHRGEGSLAGRGPANPAR